MPAPRPNLKRLALVILGGGAAAMALIFLVAWLYFARAPKPPRATGPSLPQVVAKNDRNRLHFPLFSAKETGMVANLFHETKGPIHCDKNNPS
jgi:hypothetical protein